MSQLGIGAMLHQLSGGSKHSPSEFYGMKIKNAEIDDKRLLIEFDTGKKIRVWDNGQSCCENRYITCDDDPTDLIGGELMKIEAVESGEKEGEYGDSHEWVFINVQSTTGSIQFQTHNEHNGYYGGFGLTITEET